MSSVMPDQAMKQSVAVGPPPGTQPLQSATAGDATSRNAQVTMSERIAQESLHRRASRRVPRKSTRISTKRRLVRLRRRLRVAAIHTHRHLHVSIDLRDRAENEWAGVDAPGERCGFGDVTTRSSRRSTSASG